MKLEERIREIAATIQPIVEERIREFEQKNSGDDLVWFSEMCFCILTANTSAEMGIRVQAGITPEEFATLSVDDLSSRLRNLGYRFYRTRARYIHENQKFAWNIKKILYGVKDFEKRDWLIQNIMGMGNKEASHFLRNVGYKDFAIIDKHIFKIMRTYGITNESKITEKNYRVLEEKLRRIAENLGMDLARLDLYLWYMETGKVLK